MALDLNKIKPARLFTFGCSFTKYRLNTWANILAAKLEPKKFYNFGAAGACNLFIGTRLSQAIKFYDINENDLVMICWTDIDRNSIIENNVWQLRGSIVMNYKDREYTEDDRSIYSQRDAMIIQNSYDTLQQHNIPFDMFSMANFKKSMTPSIAILYHDMLSKLKPSMIDVCMGGKIQNPDETLHGDAHPSMRQHLKYLIEVFKMQPTKEITDFINKHNLDKTPPWLRKRESLDYSWFQDLDNSI